ncbi:hypothetical protein, partial [Burkholderia sp. E168m23]|uniref:hypothetical protein n=1 Tax=Burkholderia sp. E168m23 TaxID=1561200 RepID=UPI001F32A5BB
AAIGVSGSAAALSIPPSRHDWCAAAHACRDHFGSHPLDESVYFALLSNTGDRAILLTGIARNPCIFSRCG